MSLPPRVVQESPLCAATPAAVLAEPTTPTDSFFVRNHFPVPRVDVGAWRFAVGGAVARPLALSLADLRMRRARTVTVTMECAGNSRARLSPPAKGVAWNDHAVGTATFTGVPLADVLAEAGPRAGVVEVVARGLDRGPNEAFERSLPIADAMHPDVLVATEMNGKPLEAAHGFPARLLVPGWYGVASVKWLAALDCVTEPFRGRFQAAEYVYRAPDGSVEPVRRQRLKALIVEPRDNDIVSRGEIRVRGWAWSGSSAIDRVEISVDGGRRWAQADLGPADAGPWAWRAFEFRWRATVSGEQTILARAIDEDGNAQPTAPVWNEQGYGNNGAVPVHLRVV